jgi:hypothetical protein
MNTTAEIRPSASLATRPRRLALVDLLDRVLAAGVVVSGEVTLSVADVDMVQISLRALVRSAHASVSRPADAKAGRL